jgi:carbamoyl-phosphate synthase small subunit
MLAARGCKVTVVPAQTPAAEVLKYKPDGVFLSNGPGDPEPCDYAITAIRELLARACRPTVSASATSCWRWPRAPRR